MEQGLAAKQSKTVAKNGECHLEILLQCIVIAYVDLHFKEAIRTAISVRVDDGGNTDEVYLNYAMFKHGFSFRKLPDKLNWCSNMDIEPDVVAIHAARRSDKVGFLKKGVEEHERLAKNSNSLAQGIPLLSILKWYFQSLALNWVIVKKYIIQIGASVGGTKNPLLENAARLLMTPCGLH